MIDLGIKEKVQWLGDTKFGTRVRSVQMVQVGFRISNERTKNLDCREMVLRTRSYVTKRQNCIRPCGKVQLKSLVLTMRSDFLTGGVCKVVGYYT